MKINLNFKFFIFYKFKLCEIDISFILVYLIRKKLMIKYIYEVFGLCIELWYLDLLKMFNFKGNNVIWD